MISLAFENKELKCLVWKCNSSKKNLNKHKVNYKSSCASFHSSGNLGASLSATKTSEPISCDEIKCWYRCGILYLYRKLLRWFYTLGVYCKTVVSVWVASGHVYVSLECKNGARISSHVTPGHCDKFELLDPSLFSLASGDLVPMLFWKTEYWRWSSDESNEYPLCLTKHSRFALKYWKWACLVGRTFICCFRLHTLFIFAEEIADFFQLLLIARVRKMSSLPIFKTCLKTQVQVLYIPVN